MSMTMREDEPVIVVDFFPRDVSMAPAERKCYFTLIVNGTLITYCGHISPFLQMALP